VIQKPPASRQRLFRHGTIITVTDEEYRRLETNVWSGTLVNPAQQPD
jgi:hypothetical protein